MTNYKQNKNNYWENLTGEVSQLKWSNPDVDIIPINIIFSKIPYLKAGGIIAKYENIDYKHSFEVMNILKEKKIVRELVNYSIDVEQVCDIGEKYNKCPIIVGFNKETPFRLFCEIFDAINTQKL
jgi:hypothetical protein